MIPMKILIASYGFQPHIGGVNTYIEALKKQLENMVIKWIYWPITRTCKKSALYVVVLTTYVPKEADKEIDISGIREVVCMHVLTLLNKYLPHVNAWVCWGKFNSIPSNWPQHSSV